MKGRVKYHSLVLDQWLLNKVVDKLDQQLVLSPLYLLMYLNLAQTLQLVQLDQNHKLYLEHHSLALDHKELDHDHKQLDQYYC